MLKRFAQTLALILLASYLCSDAAIAQTRRAQKRRPRSTRQTTASKLQPLTLTQKTLIGILIEEGKKIEYQYNYAPNMFSDSTVRLFDKCKKVGEILPDGNVKTFMFNLCQEYRDVGYIQSRVTGYGESAEREKLIQRIGRLSGSNNYSDPLPQILERYGLQRARPYQAIIAVLNIAIKDREFLEGVLLAAPIIPEPVADASVPESVVTTPAPAQITIYDTASTPKREAETNPLVGNWTLQVTSPDSQRYTFTLMVKQEGGALNCIIEANGERKPCTATGNSFTLTIPNIPIEGQYYNMDLAGSAEADGIKGNLTFTNRSSLSVSMPLTGTRIQ